MINRIIWIVLDSVGIGELPDAKRFDDEGCNTLEHIFTTNKGLKIPNMTMLGLGNIDGVDALSKTESPTGSFGKMAEMSAGKDTTIGHWEMAGIYSPKAFPVYPDGFSQDIINEFIKKTGVPGVLCNKPASGTEVIKELGQEHIDTGKLIVYTSGDSVFQIAAHEDVVPVNLLYEYCKAAREILVGDNAVARVIARPFIGRDGNFTRTANRRDFSLKPSEKNILSYVKNKGHKVLGVGKIEDIFAGVGLTESKHTKNNQDGIDVTLEYMKNVDSGIIFTNLVEFDSVWGHRRDYQGYAKGLEEFDDRLPEIISRMRESDLLIITADHGCDPTFKGTDHTREYVPLLLYGKQIKNVNLGIRTTFADIAATIAEIFNTESFEIGRSFLSEIMR